MADPNDWKTILDDIDLLNDLDLQSDLDGVNIKRKPLPDPENIWSELQKYAPE